MKNHLFKLVFLTMLGVMTTVETSACTNIIVGRKASVDGSVLLAYCADSYGFFDTLYFTPPMTHKSTDVREIYDWDTYKYLGHIDEVSQTYQVVGNMNEWQLTIGETTCPGREEMIDETGLIDYYSLIHLALERAKTAREAIKVMVSLTEKYGYYSDGETFSICDPNEAWLLFMDGCGKDRFVSEERTVWVALRVPDKAIAAHANYCRLTKFLDGRYTRLTLDELQTKYPADSENLPDLMVCSNNVVNYARKMGWYEGTDADFSYNAAYAMNGFSDRRYAEPRVWSILNRYSDNMNQYLNYASAVDLNAEPMPLWIVPELEVSVEDLRIAMRDHFEDTPFSNSNDISSGWLSTPYSILPLRYVLDGENYFSERTISVVESGWAFVAQMRSWMPRELGRLWFGNDDANMVAMTPIYNSITRAPQCYTGEGASDVEFSMDNAYWVCNWVANMIYPKYSMMFPTLENVRDSLESSYSGQQPELEQQALALSGEARKKLLTDYCCLKGDEMIDRWRKMAFHLIVKYNDMVVRPTNPDGSFILDETGHAITEYPNISEVFGRGLIQLTGDRYRDLTTDNPPTSIAPTLILRRRAGTDKIYLPSGAQVSHPVKGVNIKNNRKYIYKGSE